MLGWIGTHSTFPYLESIFPVLGDLARRHKFRLKVVGAGKEGISVPGVALENSAWEINREVEDFQSIDIGLYPIDASLYSGWASGKSGFKAVQYMAVGVPYVAIPVGGSAEIGEAGTTHFFAMTDEEWYQALDGLLASPDLREQMGAAGRRHVIEHYGLEAQADKLANALRRGQPFKMIECDTGVPPVNHAQDARATSGNRMHRTGKFRLMVLGASLCFRHFSSGRATGFFSGTKSVAGCGSDSA